MSVESFSLPSGQNIQDAGTSRLPGQEFVTFHTHGERQYYGSCKLHSRPDCPVLVNWKPGGGLGKTIMREWVSEIPSAEWRCKKCWPKDEGLLPVAAAVEVLRTSEWEAWAKAFACVTLLSDVASKDDLLKRLGEVAQTIESSQAYERAREVPLVLPYVQNHIKVVRKFQATLDGVSVANVDSYVSKLTSLVVWLEVAPRHLEMRLDDIESGENPQEKLRRLLEEGKARFHAVCAEYAPQQTGATIHEFNTRRNRVGLNLHLSERHLNNGEWDEAADDLTAALAGLDHLRCFVGLSEQKEWLNVPFFKDTEGGQADGGR